jgi:transcriptional regulator with XRE-family HTH domain
MARRYKEARLLNNMKVAEAIEKLKISQPTLSAWEGERKSPSIDALEHMADLYGVSTDYLLGRSVIRMREPTFEISLEHLYVLNGQPVWSMKYGWMLVHASEQVLLLSNGTTIPFRDVGPIYTTPPPFTENLTVLHSPLKKAALSKYDELWVEPISSDSLLRNELRGWYRVKNRYVENEFGTRFYLDSYGAKWLAFETEL